MPVDYEQQNIRIGYTPNECQALLKTLKIAMQIALNKHDANMLDMFQRPLGRMRQLISGRKKKKSA